MDFLSYPFIIAYPFIREVRVFRPVYIRHIHFCDMSYNLWSGFSCKQTYTTVLVHTPNASFLIFGSYIQRLTYYSLSKNPLQKVVHFALFQVIFIYKLFSSVCFIKIHSKHNSNTLPSLQRIFMKQTLPDMLCPGHTL